MGTLITTCSDKLVTQAFSDLVRAYLTEMRGLINDGPAGLAKPLDEGLREPGPRTFNFFFAGTEPCGTCVTSAGFSGLK